MHVTINRNQNMINDLVPIIIKDIDANSEQSSDAVIMLTGDWDSLNTDSFVNDCNLVVLNDSVDRSKRNLDLFFIFQPGFNFRHRNVPRC
jgi:hypothetical protein